MNDIKNDNKKETESGYGKEVLNVFLFFVFMIIVMIVIAHFRP